MNTQAHNIAKEIKQQLKPTHHNTAPQEFIKELNKLLTNNKIAAQAVLGGSYAKGTYLPGDHDVDIFVIFKEHYTDQDMSDITQELLAKNYQATRLHGSRDYFQLTKEGLDYEIVPVSEVTDPTNLRNVTDMSPQHVDYIKAQLKKKPSLADEIRLTKQFMKASKVYGAESYIKGFSGHVVDLLIIEYQGFIPLLQAAANWEERTFIDISKEQENARSLNSAKTQGPLVILDPVQEQRNAAAALGYQAYNTFAEQAQEFLNKPSETFFEVIPLRQQVQKGFRYELHPQKGSQDVVGTKLYKAHKHFLSQAKDTGFIITEEGFEFDGTKAFCYLQVKEEPLPQTEMLMGPPIHDTTSVERFIHKHPQADFSDHHDHIVCTQKRAITTLKELANKIFTEEYITSRSTKTKIL